jgi:hypothetical protein
MAEIVNLRRARKAKTKLQKDAKAEANRILHGRTKAEKNHARAQSALETAKFDAHKMPGKTTDE